MAQVFEDKTVQKSDSERTLLTIQGESAVINGDFVISRSIEIDCEVRGKLDIQGQIIVQKNGFVKADVKTKNAEIIGRFEGSLEASGNVEIKETGFVYGNIKTDSLIISKGGIFSGKVERMSDVRPPEDKAEAPAGKASKPINPLADPEPIGNSKLGL